MRAFFALTVLLLFLASRAEAQLDLEAVDRWSATMRDWIAWEAVNDERRHEHFVVEGRGEFVTRLMKNVRARYHQYPELQDIFHRHGFDDVEAFVSVSTRILFAIFARMGMLQFIEAERQLAAHEQELERAQSLSEEQRAESLQAMQQVVDLARAEMENLRHGVPDGDIRIIHEHWPMFVELLQLRF